MKDSSLAKVIWSPINYAPPAKRAATDIKPALNHIALYMFIFFHQYSDSLMTRETLWAEEIVMAVLRWSHFEYCSGVR